MVGSVSILRRLRRIISVTRWLRRHAESLTTTASRLNRVTEETIEKCLNSRATTLFRLLGANLPSICHLEAAN